MLKIALNLTEINPHYKGGINTYTHGLINGFLNIKNESVIFNLICTENNYSDFKKYIDNKYFLITKMPNRNLLLKIIKNLLFWVNNKNLFKIFSNFLWQDVIKITRDYDVIYWPTTVLNFFDTNTKTLVSMHDIQHVHYPHFFSLKEKLVRNLYFNLTISHVNFIQASSIFIKKDILNNFKSINKQQIEVIKEGVLINQFSSITYDNNIKKKYSIPHDYIFYPA